MDNGLFIAQSKFILLSNSFLFYSYNIVSNFLLKFSLIAKYSKTEVFHFIRSQGSFNLPPLNLSSIGRSILYPKDFWKYLEFIFNRKLSFHKHIDFFSNMMISIVKYIKILGNSIRDLNPHQKQLLYRSYILPIALYRF